MLKAIKTKKQHEQALNRIYSQMQKNIKPRSKLGNELEVLSILVDKYEDEHHPVSSPDPIEAIKFAMEHKHLKRKDLVKIIGHKSRVSEVLNRKRKLTIPMIRSLHRTLKIPLESLIQEY